MMNLLASAVRRIVPGYDEMSPSSQAYLRLMAGIVLYALPVAVVGLVWLVRETRLDTLEGVWPVLLALLVITVILKRLTFFVTIEVTPGAYTSATSSMDAIVWAAALIFGPAALWIDIIAEFITDVMDFSRRYRPQTTDLLELNVTMALSLATRTAPRLAGLALYTALGGAIPISSLAWPNLGPALAATAVQLGLSLLIILPWLGAGTYITVASFPGARPARILLDVFKLWVGTSFLMDPVGVFVAALYTHSGPGVFFFFLGGLLAASLIGSRLSRTAELTRQRSRELEQLEQLGRALLAAPLDASALPDLLDQHLPGMFSFGGVEVMLFPDRLLCRHGEDWGPAPPAVWPWLAENPGRYFLRQGARAPWDGAPLRFKTLVLPIQDEAGLTPLGGLYLVQRDQRGRLEDMEPAAQTLAAQIGAALHLADAYEETLELARTSRELDVAGQIQATFLPGSAPQIEGWQITATLESARQTSGDFFDIIPMWDNRLGIVMADVADKGLGAALYMALSRTLLRTYAVEYSTRYPDTYAYHPERVLNTVNQCILEHAQSDLFVTVFYGIIDPKLSTLTFANAGHNPGLLISGGADGGGARLQVLSRTGIPMGILPDATWDRESVHMAPGDVLVLYTDGLVEAENIARQPWGDERLRRTLLENAGRPAQAIRAAMVDACRAHVGGAPRHDDLTLLVVQREK
jgi:serine phosphatase RsbU (regulator of sigma subunit)